MVEKEFGLERSEQKSDLPQMEPRLAQLWSVYDSARAEYLQVGNRSDEQTLRTAKFLRDTAENIVQYLKNRNADPIMLAELSATFNMAKATVVSLSGGKKRKFDPVEMDEVKGVPRGPWRDQDQDRRQRRRPAYTYGNQYGDEQSSGYGPSGRGTSYGNPNPVPPAPRSDRGREDKYGGGRMPTSITWDEDTRDHPRRERRERREPRNANTYPPTSSEHDRQRERFDHESGTSFSRLRSRFRELSRGRSPSRRRSLSRGHSIDSGGSRRVSRSVSASEPEARRRGHGKGKGKKKGSGGMRGRGHSGIPYGYSAWREVDSYVPGRDDDEMEK